MSFKLHPANACVSKKAMSGKVLFSAKQENKMLQNSNNNDSCQTVIDSWAFLFSQIKGQIQKSIIVANSHTYNKLIAEYLTVESWQIMWQCIFTVKAIRL